MSIFPPKERRIFPQIKRSELRNTVSKERKRAIIKIG
jgi:hypothetical protein